MLLTRSPLSPGPKAWFSLDLHVLSAPPAFVLSQDQTLREEVVRRQAGETFTLSLSSKVGHMQSRQHGTDEDIPCTSDEVQVSTKNVRC